MFTGKHTHTPNPPWTFQLTKAWSFLLALTYPPALGRALSVTGGGASVSSKLAPVGRFLPAFSPPSLPPTVPSGFHFVFT